MTDRTDWFHSCRYGVMLHFLPQPWIEMAPKHPFFRKAELPAPTEWNRIVDRFDTGIVVDQLSEIRAGYLILSLGQISGYYLAPNPVYDKYTGFKPGERCSIRDLPLELGKALESAGIRLMLYLPVEPSPEAEAAFGWQPGATTRSDLFIERWAEVVQWWSDHYGIKLAGWWFDGEGSTPEQNVAITQAARHGNPDAIINLGESADYIGGHSAMEHKRIPDPECLGRLDWVVQVERLPESRLTAEGAQWHALLHFGEHWGDRDGFYDTDTEVGYTREVVRRGGVVTWDCGPNIGRDPGPIGPISDIQMSKLRLVRDAVWTAGAKLQ